MNSRTLFATLLMTCLLAAGFLGVAPIADAAPVGQSLPKPGESASHYVMKVDDHGYGPMIYPPSIGPGWAYQEAPYYFSRGYYPTHIGRYFYYGYPRGEGDDESASHRADHDNEDYSGCTEQQDCD